MYSAGMAECSSPTLGAASDRIFVACNGQPAATINAIRLVDGSAEMVYQLSGPGVINTLGLGLSVDSETAYFGWTWAGIGHVSAVPTVSGSVGIQWTRTLSLSEGQRSSLIDAAPVVLAPANARVDASATTAAAVISAGFDGCACAASYATIMQWRKFSLMSLTDLTDVYALFCAASPCTTGVRRLCPLDVRRFDAHSGNQSWAVQPADISSCQFGAYQCVSVEANLALFHDGKAVAVSTMDGPEHGAVHALSTSDGQILWTAEAHGSLEGSTSSPVFTASSRVVFIGASVLIAHYPRVLAPLFTNAQRMESGTGKPVEHSGGNILLVGTVAAYEVPPTQTP